MAGWVGSGSPRNGYFVLLGIGDLSEQSTYGGPDI